MTCPAPVPGAATAGALLTPADCFALGQQGVPYQWQDGTIISDKPGACAHYRANQIVTGETWLTVTLVGSRDPQDYAACPYPPLGQAIPVGTGWHDGAGNLYTISGHYAPHNGNCREQSGGDATAGSVTYTAASDTALEASYDLTFAAGRVTGTFAAPVCGMAGCPPRPSKTACVAS